MKCHSFSKVPIKKRAGLVKVSSQDIVNFNHTAKESMFDSARLYQPSLHIQVAADRQDLTQEFVTQCKHAQNVHGSTQSCSV